MSHAAAVTPRRYLSHLHDAVPSCTGNAPAKKSAFVSWVKRMVDSGKMVVRVPQQCQSSFSVSRFSEQQAACSQCLRGRVELEVYSVGKALHDAGVVSRRLVQLRRFQCVSLTLRCSPQISALDMTCEAVVTKMAYLLSLKVISPSFCQIILRHNPPPPHPSPPPPSHPQNFPLFSSVPFSSHPVTSESRSRRRCGGS